MLHSMCTENSMFSTSTNPPIHTYAYMHKSSTKRQVHLKCSRHVLGFQGQTKLTLPSAVSNGESILLTLQLLAFTFSFTIPFQLWQHLQISPETWIMELICFTMFSEKYWMVTHTVSQARRSLLQLQCCSGNRSVICMYRAPTRATELTLWDSTDHAQAQHDCESCASSPGWTHHIPHKYRKFLEVQSASCCRYIW